MKRLTKKNEIGYDTTGTYNSYFNATIKIVNKLGQLEDIEEELGIDLITLFKALKYGVFVVESNERFIVDDEIERLDVSNGVFTTHNEYLELEFKDYGKTWALTTKELMEEI